MQLASSSCCYSPAISTCQPPTTNQLTASSFVLQRLRRVLIHSLTRCLSISRSWSHTENYFSFCPSLFLCVWITDRHSRRQTDSLPKEDHRHYHQPTNQLQRRQRPKTMNLFPHFFSFSPWIRRDWTSPHIKKKKEYSSKNENFCCHTPKRTAFLFKQFFSTNHNFHCAFTLPTLCTPITSTTNSHI